MRATNYMALNAPIRLHVEYGKMTVGELSNILRHWQALLRAVWREVYEQQYRVKAPNTHVLIVASSTGKSLDLVSDYAIYALLLANPIVGPVTDWPRQARAAYAYLSLIWTAGKKEYLNVGQERVTIMGGDRPAMTFPSHMLENEEIAGRLESLWKIANSGDMSFTVEEPDESDTNDPADGKVKD